MHILMAITWIVYAVLEGVRDGYFYHYRNTSTSIMTENIHFIYLIQRALFWMSIIIIHGTLYNIIDTIAYAFSLAFMFSFLHNNVYYETRNRLSPGVYPKGWRSISTTSEAKMEFTFTQRTALMLFGIALLIITML